MVGFPFHNISLCTGFDRACSQKICAFECQSVDPAKTMPPDTKVFDPAKSAPSGGNEPASKKIEERSEESQEGQRRKSRKVNNCDEIVEEQRLYFF